MRAPRGQVAQRLGRDAAIMTRAGHRVRGDGRSIDPRFGLFVTHDLAFQEIPIHDDMMTDPADHDASTTGLAGLPMQPTGSGVADLEVAYERMELAAAAEPDQAAADDASATTTGDDAIESEAHPS